eukprot:scaffold2009_cov370-Prasinococcus_capsulatus_cf.AAC.6
MELGMDVEVVVLLSLLGLLLQRVSGFPSLCAGRACLPGLRELEPPEQTRAIRPNTLSVAHALCCRRCGFLTLRWTDMQAGPSDVQPRRAAPHAIRPASAVIVAPAGHRLRAPPAPQRERSNPPRGARRGPMSASCARPRRRSLRHAARTTGGACLSGLGQAGPARLLCHAHARQRACDAMCGNEVMARWATSERIDRRECLPAEPSAASLHVGS